MGKSRKKHEKTGNTKPAPVVTQLSAAAPSSAPEPPASTEASPDPETAGPSAAAAPPSRRRWLRFAPDLIKAALAVAVIAVAIAIWYQPPLIRADFPRLSYCFEGVWRNDATLYRPLAMPTRYYIGLPRELAGRYTWFAVDRRREIAALTPPPGHHLLGRTAIKRSDPLGLDLEFRKLDQSEWRVFFLPEAIVFSNAVLSIRLDTTPERPVATQPPPPT